MIGDFQFFFEILLTMASDLPPGYAEISFADDVTLFDKTEPIKNDPNYESLFDHFKVTHSFILIMCFNIC